MPSSAENQHPYDRRGWCIFEMYLSSLVKDDYCFLKLSEMGGTQRNWSAIRNQCKVSRPAPMSPDAFEAMLNAGVQKEAESLGSGIKFTSGKDLTEVVIPQYKKGFLRLMGAADILMYDELGWGDEEVKILAAALVVKDKNGRGALPSLTELSLRNNSIGDEGMKAFAAAVGSGALPSLTELRLYANKIGDEGMKAFAAAVGSGALPSLTKLKLSGNQIRDEGMKAFAAAVGRGALPKLQDLDVSDNPASRASQQAAKDAIKNRSK